MDAWKGILGITLIILEVAIYLAVIGLPIFYIIKFIKAGMGGQDIYTKWTIMNVVLGILVWKLGLISVIAEIITYLIAKDHKAKEEKWNEQYTNTTYEPGPGSDSHYEQWKAEREERED